MATVQISLPAPHPAQRDVLAAAKRFNVLACGRRWGKSTIGIDRIVAPVLEGFPCGWFSPGYKLLAEAWRELQDVLAPVITGRNNAEFRLEVRGGGSITMFSLDTEVSDSVRGRAFKSVVIDEAALVRNLRQVWEQSIRATLADHRGAAWFLSTPRGTNDFKLFFDRGQDPEREDWASWQMPTSANPYIDPEEIAAARDEMTGAAFEQEFLAQFVNWEGSVFRNVLECATAERQAGPQPGHEYIVGADWGRSADYTVFVVIDATDRAMVDMDRSNKVDYVVQRGRLQALYDRWKPVKIIAEQNSIGQPIIEELQRSGLPVQPFITTSGSKAVAIEALALAFERRDIAILNDPVLLGELQAFQAEQLPGGALRYSAPSGGHDDAVISLALAWTMLRPAPRCGLYPITAPDLLYSDLTRPRDLSACAIERWVSIHLGLAEPTVFAEYFDDGETIWLEREYYFDPRLTGTQKTEPELIDILIHGGDNWPGFDSISPRHWPSFLVAPEASGFAAQVRAQGGCVITSAPVTENEVRKLAAMIARKRFRIHERCVNLRREMAMVTPDDLTRPDVSAMLIATRIYDWRIAS